MGYTFAGPSDQSIQFGHFSHLEPPVQGPDNCGPPPYKLIHSCLFLCMYLWHPHKKFRSMLFIFKLSEVVNLHCNGRHLRAFWEYLSMESITSSLSLVSTQHFFPQAVKLKLVINFNILMKTITESISNICCNLFYLQLTRPPVYWSYKQCES
jgi:hypothetical protein